MSYPQFLKDWETVKELGSGSFGKVYEIKKNHAADSVKYHSALKVLTIPPSPEAYSAYLNSGYTHEEVNSIINEQVSSIEKECEIMADLKGLTNIVSYEEHAVRRLDDGITRQILIRMELLFPLVQYLNTQPVTDRLVISLGMDICTALERCLQKKIIHRDIKPHNLFINWDGDFKLGDFGIAKTIEHMTAGTKIGTYHYMAPEVYLNRPYDHRVDIYSLGLVLYWILNERRLPFLPLPPAPVTGKDFETALLSRIKGDALPPPKNGSPALKQAVLKACAFRPEDRYDTPTMFKDALHAASCGAEAGEDTLPPPVFTPPTAGPVSKEPEDNTCPWCFGRGGQLFVHREKKRKYIAYTHRCRLCSGKGRLETASISPVKQQLNTLLHSHERWNANLNCHCCRGRGWVYSDNEADKRISELTLSFFGKITPCPRCAGHRVTMVQSSKQRAKFNSRLRLSLLCKSALLCFFLSIILSVYSEDIAGSKEFALAIGILVIWFLIYPIRFYYRYRKLPFVKKAALKATVAASYFTAILSSSIVHLLIYKLLTALPASAPNPGSGFSLSADDLQGEAREAFNHMVSKINHLMR